MKTDKTKVKRIPQRGFYDKEHIYQILDSDFVCQIAFVYEHYPVVLPIIYGRKEDCLYFHGASVSRLLVSMEGGIPVSLNVTRTDGIVLARSAFHHSVNYRSVTVFGSAELVTDAEERLAALKVISDQVLPGRWEEVRQPNRKELKATKVLKLQITEASAKIRTGPPKDEKADFELNVWAGVLPIESKFGKPKPDVELKSGIELPKSLVNIMR